MRTQKIFEHIDPNWVANLYLLIWRCVHIRPHITTLRGFGGMTAVPPT